MSALASRLPRIERFRAPCSTCYGLGKYNLTESHDGKPPPPPPEQMEGCPECGEVFHININYVTKTCIER